MQTALGTQIPKGHCVMQKIWMLPTQDLKGQAVALNGKSSAIVNRRYKRKQDDVLLWMDLHAVK